MSLEPAGLVLAQATRDVSQGSPHNRRPSPVPCVKALGLELYQEVPG